MSAPRVRHPTTSSSKRSELSTFAHRGMGCTYVSRSRCGHLARRLAVGAGATQPVERDERVDEAARQWCSRAHFSTARRPPRAA